MEQFSVTVLLIGAVALFFKSLVEKALWSIALYLCRGEFNHDNNESTPDAFLHFNPNTGKFQKCYITKYTLLGVHWGFFHDGGYVSKFYFWADWASDKTNRFPIPIKVDSQNEASLVKFIKGR